MAGIRLKEITKTYGSVKALDQISLDIKNNEFFVIFGPAGAGKTSILNVIAGITDPDEGDVYFDEKNMNYVEPKDRDVAMVFENYALYPHKTVYENIASSMRTKMHRQPQEIIDQKVKEVAELLNITELLERQPAQASNGQRQRIALGRALVRNPNVFLMDEPLAHLDAKLRNFMRKELKSIQERLHSTTVYVTHDYTEAMSLGDRIAVVNEGKIVQTGTAGEVYEFPGTEFVAKLFGDCEINLIPGQVVQEQGKLYLKLPWENHRCLLPEDVARVLREKEVTTVDLGARSAAIEYFRTPEEGCIQGQIYTNEPLGNKVELVVKAEQAMIRFTVKVDEKFQIDEKIYLRFDMEKCLFFHSDTKEFLARHQRQTVRGGRGNGRAETESCL